MTPNPPEGEPGGEGKAHKLQELWQDGQLVHLVDQAVGQVQHQQASTTPGKGLVPVAAVASIIGEVNRGAALDGAY